MTHNYESRENLSSLSHIRDSGWDWWSFVEKEEHDHRRANGSSSSTVLLKVLGEESVHDLCRHSIWVGGSWCLVRRFVAVPPKLNEEEFRRRFGVLKEAVGEKKKGIGRLLRVKNKAAKRIAYGEALKACDDEEGTDTEDDERFIRRMGIILEEVVALKREKLWGEGSAKLMARARGRRGVDMGKANELGKKLEKRLNKGRVGSGKGKEKVAFVVSDGDDDMLSDSDAMARRMWLDGGGR
ncbi:hypothetical protein HOY80DRAFT_1100112 [Tuber brumale]|nr:hypothetical protein HOY80DRAFT_1100112 [Tuber brumale]